VFNDNKVAYTLNQESLDIILRRLKRFVPSPEDSQSSQGIET
jgi:hypothetical protein